MASLSADALCGLDAEHWAPHNRPDCSGQAWTFVTSRWVRRPDAPRHVLRTRSWWRTLLTLGVPTSFKQKRHLKKR